MIININIYFKSLITFCLVIIIEKLKIYFCDYNWILYKIFENVNIFRLSGSLFRKLGSKYWKNKKVELGLVNSTFDLQYKIVNYENSSSKRILNDSNWRCSPSRHS